MDNVIQQAIQVVSAGGIVIYPTDTAFGIGCRIDATKSVDRLFSLRRRAATQAMPVLVDSIEMALAYFIHPSDIVRHLMKHYWPGALTVISWCDTEAIYSPIRGGGKTIGMRMPDHEAPLSIISGIGVPMLGSSANFHGEKTPYRYEDLDPALIALVDYVVPGVCPKGNASTVVDATTTPISILRQGAVVVKERDTI